MLFLEDVQQNRDELTVSGLALKSASSGGLVFSFPGWVVAHPFVSNSIINQSKMKVFLNVILNFALSRSTVHDIVTVQGIWGNLHV